MPVFATYDDLKRLRPAPDNEQRLLREAASRSGKSVFLSHSSKDNELIPSVVGILEGEGGRVYVDLGDDRLPDVPSPETAAILRDTVRQTQSFVLLVTPNSKDSIWIPWELGLADGAHGPARVSLFPVANAAAEMRWSEQEYLGLYQRIVWGRIKGYERELWMVWDHHDNTATPLRRWLNSD